MTPRNEVRATMSIEGIRRNQKVVISDMVKIGKRLGVDYIVYGEVLNYQLSRGKGIHIPYLIGFPRTVAEIEVVIQLVNVSDGTISYVESISASSSKSEGVLFFSGSKENKLNQLSGVESNDLIKELLKNWSENLRGRMFQNLDSISGNDS